jgi:hypothetical protein
MARTLPAQFPALNEREAHNHQPTRAKLLRNLALAQNYLWAKTPRIYTTGAVEGWGNERVEGYTYPLAVEVNNPMGANGHCVASFICPPNWGAGNILQVKGRGVLTLTTTGTGTVQIQVHELDETPVGLAVSTQYTSAGANDWTLNIHTPKDRTFLLRVYLSIDGGTAGDLHSIEHVSARYAVPAAGELGLDAASATWKPLAYTTTAADEPLSSALLKALVRDTNHLHVYRNPEVCQAWLGRHYANTTTWTEVGRYIVYVPSRVTKLRARALAYCTHTGANTAIRVKLNGVVQFTSSTLAVGETDVDCSEYPVTDEAEATLTIEAQSDAGGADWGTMVYGFWCWEEEVDLALPTGNTVPAAFQPLEDDLLVMGKAVVADTVGSMRAGLKKLLENNIWLARHRLRWLVGDWRHKTLKRLELTGVAGTNYDGWDWTPGANEETYRRYAPKNITLVPGQTDTLGAPFPHEGKDGHATWPYGLPDTWTPGSLQRFARHGRRLGKYRTDDGTGTDSIRATTGAGFRWYSRGRRLGPQAWLTDNGITLLNANDKVFENRGSFYIYGDFSQVFKQFLRSSAAHKDTETQTTGPMVLRWADFTAAADILTIHGMNEDFTFPEAAEGEWFEMELQSVLIMDEPLSQAALDALT